MDAARRCLLQLIAHLLVNTMMAFGGPIWWPQRAAHLGANSEMKLEYDCRPLTEKTYNGLTISAPGYVQLHAPTIALTITRPITPTIARH